MKINSWGFGMGCLIVAAGLILWLLVSPTILTYGVGENARLMASSWVGFAVCLAGVTLTIYGMGTLLEANSADWLVRIWRYLTERTEGNE